MQSPETVAETAWVQGEGREGEVSLWEDSVGTATRQLGVIVAFAIAVRLATRLVLGR